MAPTRTKKRPSGPTPSPRPNQTTVPTKTGTPTRTPHNRSPIKKAKPGLTIAQKQALIDNLQLEITERARRLRAQYNLQAQGLRSRIEIRINRIPISLRRMTMGDLLARYERDGQRRAPAQEALPPPVPAKDAAPRSPVRPAYASVYKTSAYKNSSDELAGPGKENDTMIENPKRRTRAANAPSQILSPASSNSRLVPARDHPAFPTKSLIARPASPAKPRTGILSSMVEKAKASRPGARKATTSSTASSTGAPPPAARTKKAAPGAGPTRTTARAARRVSASSSASTETTSTVVRKGGRPPARKAPAAKKAPVAKKAPARAPAAGGTGTGTGRVLRNRRG